MRVLYKRQQDREKFVLTIEGPCQVHLGSPVESFPFQPTAETRAVRRRRRAAAADILLTPPPLIVTDRRAAAAAADRMSMLHRRRFRDVSTSCCLPATCC